MICQDHVRGLSLFDQRTNDPIDLVKFLFCQVDSFSGGSEQFLIMTLRGFGVIGVLGMDRTLMWLFGTAITDKRSFLNTNTMLTDKVFADTVAAVAGSAFRITDKELVTGIRFFATIPVNAEVVGIIEASAIPGIHDPMFPDLFRDSRRIFADVFRDLTKRFAIIQRLFNVKPVFQREMLMVPGNDVRHNDLLCRRRER